MKLTVTLAECPTDVLAWLVITQPGGGTQDEIADAMAVTCASNLASAVVRSHVGSALRLLLDMRLVDATITAGGGSMWRATRDGVDLVATA